MDEPKEFEQDYDYDDFPDDEEPCDHEHADFDILIGRESCSCGWSRYLTTEEYQRRSELEAQAQAEWDAFCREQDNPRNALNTGDGDETK